MLLTQELETLLDSIILSGMATCLHTLTSPIKESSTNFATMWDLKLIKYLIFIMAMQDFNLLKASLIVIFTTTLLCFSKEKMMVSQEIQTED